LTTVCGLGIIPFAVTGENLENDLAMQVALAETQRDAQISEIRSIRHYILRNPRWKSDGTMDVRMTTFANGKKKYDILGMSVEGIQKQVFLRILEGEVQSAERKVQEGAVTPENYDMRPTGIATVNGRQCRTVDLIPKRRTRFTLEGKACIDTNDMAVVRMEGRTAKSVSFWVGHPYVVQEYRKIGNFWLSANHQSTADVKFLGTTQLFVQYVDYSVTPKNGAMLMACAAACSPNL